MCVLECPLNVFMHVEATCEHTLFAHNGFFSKSLQCDNVLDEVPPEHQSLTTELCSFISSFFS